jgi:transcription initiation factor TFIIIB Brf1 subunit/transcription initiation factor TFIIB
MDFDDFFSLCDSVGKSYNEKRDDESCDYEKIKECMKECNNDKLSETYCNVCNTDDSVINDGEMRVCTNCGTQHGDIIDDSAEWRYYGNEDNKRGADPTRCGMPHNQILGISSLSTVVIGHGFEKYRKLSRWNGLTHKERELIKLLNELRRKCNIENLPESVTEKTIHMWKTISEDYIKRGTSKESLYAACFVYALQDSGITRSTDEICKLFGIKQKKLTKGCNEFVELMYHKDKKYIKKTVTCVDTKDLCSQYAKLLDYNDMARQMSIRVAILVHKMGICTSSNPKSVSVGILYLISDHYKLGVSKKQISDLCKVSDVTISNTYNQIMKYKKILLC